MSRLNTFLLCFTPTETVCYSRHFSEHVIQVRNPLTGKKMLLVAQYSGSDFVRRCKWFSVVDNNTYHQRTIVVLAPNEINAYLHRQTFNTDTPVEDALSAAEHFLSTTTEWAYALQDFEKTQ